MSNKKIWDYFDDIIEYPTQIVHNPIPYGEAWSYVSSTILNGFINYVKPISCYVVDRNTNLDKIIIDKNLIVYDKNGVGCHNCVGTKLKFINSIISGDLEMRHTKLNCFQDDIIVLAKIETERSDNVYVFFWFDMDVSNCTIGKFKTTDDENIVIQSVTNWLDDCKFENVGKIIEENTDNGIIDYHQLPLSFFNGWLTF